MPNWGFGLVYSENDLELVEQLGKELGVDTFDFPTSPQQAQLALNTDNKLEKKLNELYEERDVTRFALLIAAAMFVGAKIQQRHIGLLKNWLESDIKGDLHLDGKTIMLQACKSYQQGRALDIPGMGNVILCAQGMSGTGIKAPEAYTWGPQGNIEKKPEVNAYPEPDWLGKRVGFGQWGTGIFQSDAQLDVLDDISDKLGVEHLYWSLDDEGIRNKLEKDDSLNKLLNRYAEGDESVIPGLMSRRKKDANKFCFAVGIALAISNGVKISDVNRQRIAQYLEESNCGLGNQGWLDLRHAIRTYRDGFFLPLQGPGLNDTIKSMYTEEARYRLAKKRQQQQQKSFKEGKLVEKRNANHKSSPS